MIIRRLIRLFDTVIVFDGAFYPVDLRLHQTGNAEFCADLDGLSADLGIIGFSLIAHVLQLHFPVDASQAGSVIIQNIQWAFTSMEAAMAQICFIFVVGFAFLILEATALHIFVEAFIRFHKS